MIHGTFAKNALWTSSESSLCKTLKEKLRGDLVIERFPWSGANRNLDRIEAGKKLAGVLWQNIERYPDAAHLVIAHSHGGNIALYALNDAHLQEKLTGIICMNTPFISVTRRDAEQLFFGLKILSIIAAIVGVAMGFAILAGDSFTHNIKYIAAAAWVMVVLFALDADVFDFRSLLRLERLQSWLKERREETIARLTLPNIRGPTVLCLWTAGDEVFAIFSMLGGSQISPMCY
jgi:hypothetical protein